jgi:cyclase
MHIGNRLAGLFCIAGMFVLGTPLATAQGRGAPAGIATSKIADNLYVFSGGGGANSTLLIDSDRALLVDSKISVDAGQAILVAAAEIFQGDVEFLINSHVHPDHTGGNLVFGERGTLIIGHNDVATILTAGQRGGPPAPRAAIPAVTFADGEGIDLHFGDELVRVRHMPAAHTTDNSIIQFVNANVFHLGDLYGPARYPVLAGGTIDGFIDGVEQVLEMSDADSQFVPGVGRVTGRTELTYFLEMLTTVRARVGRAIGDGQSLEQVVASVPTAEFDHTFGAPDGARFLPIIYQQMSGSE